MLAVFTFESFRVEDERILEIAILLHTGVKPVLDKIGIFASIRFNVPERQKKLACMYDAPGQAFN